MPKKRKVLDKVDEKENCRLRLWAPTAIPYIDIKKQLVAGCIVPLRRLSKNAINVKYKSDLPVRKCEEYVNELPSVFLTPNSDSSMVIASASTTDRKPLTEEWLDGFDDLTQLLIGCLLLEQYILFASVFSARMESVNTSQLRAISQVLETYPCSRVIQCLEITLEIEPSSKMKKRISSLILSLIINESRTSAKIERNALDLLDFAYKHKIRLLKKITILDENIDELPVCLLIVELLLLKGFVKDAFRILTGNKFILKFVTQTRARNDYIAMYTTTLINTFRLIYKFNKSTLALKLALFNISNNAWPTSDETWASLALFTLLNDFTCDASDLARLFKQLVINQVNIPHPLQRVVLIQLFRNNFQDIHHLFLTLPVYSQFRNSFPIKGPVPAKLKLGLTDSWTKEEMEMALIWLNNTFKEKKPNADVKFVAIIETDKNDCACIIDDGQDGLNLNISERFLQQSGKNPKKMLAKLISRLKLEIVVTLG